MTFNTPNINDILTTLIGNNMLVSALKENGALITKETLLNEFYRTNFFQNQHHKLSKK